MNCLHYGEYTSSNEYNSKTGSTFRKGCKASIYARKAENDEKQEKIIVNTICSEHNHQRYTEGELLGLMKFKDLPSELTQKALELFYKGKILSDIFQEVKISFKE